MKKDKSCKIEKKAVNNVNSDLPNQLIKKDKDKFPSSNLIYNILDQPPAAINTNQKSNRENKFFTEKSHFTPEIYKKTSFSLSPKNNQYIVFYLASLFFLLKKTTKKT